MSITPQHNILHTSFSLSYIRGLKRTLKNGRVHSGMPAIR